MLCFCLQETAAVYVTSCSSKPREPLKFQNHVVVNDESKENISFLAMCHIKCKMIIETFF